MPIICSKCHAVIKAAEAHHHQASVLCEACWMDVRAKRTRKTHWQYLNSIKTDYLIPAKKGPK